MSHNKYDKDTDTLIQISGNATVPIDDTTASTDKVYSSSKVESSLLGVLKPIPHSRVFKIPDLATGTYMYVGENNEYLGICFFRLYRHSAYSTQLILWGAGDDAWVEGYDQDGKSFSKPIPSTEVLGIYLKDSSTFDFTGDSFDSGSNKLYKLS